MKVHPHTPASRPVRTLLALLLLVLLPARPAQAYSVLSHEEVVDMAWLTTIVPMLQARFPGLSDADILQAHAYAYGGSVIQDIGYYPFGNKYFSDLLHYVRTGDFVSTLIRDSTTPNEYAFALGALAHYCGDVYGHPAINLATADEFPRLRRRFGRSVTYDEDKTAHLRTEFSFDVVEVAHGRYSQQNYRDFIGFQVAKPLLERAFVETYGIPMNSVLKREDLAIATYRKAVSSLIPHMTEVAVLSYKQQIAKENPGFDQKKFVYRLRTTEFEQQYGKEYIHPGVRTRFVAFLVEHLPKIGPLKALKLSIPNAAEQQTYIKSINTTVDHFKLNLAQVIPPTAVIPGLPPAPYPAAPLHLLGPPSTAFKSNSQPNTSSLDVPPPGAPSLTAPPSRVGSQDPLESSTTNSSKKPNKTPEPSSLTPAAAIPAAIAAPTADLAPTPSLSGTQRAPDLAEIDLDTGKPSRFGEYHLADITYARLLDDLLHQPTPQLSPDLQQSFKDFYEGPRTEPAWYVKQPKDWAKLQTDLQSFDALPPVDPGAPTEPPAPNPNAPHP